MTTLLAMVQPEKGTGKALPTVVAYNPDTQLYFRRHDDTGEIDKSSPLNVDLIEKLILYDKKGSFISPAIADFPKFLNELNSEVSTNLE